MRRNCERRHGTHRRVCSRRDRRVALKDAGGFDHNAHSIRLVTRLETPYAGFDGLNLTWEALEDGCQLSQALAAVVEAFGREVLTETGTLDREALGRRVFADDEEHLALAVEVEDVGACDAVGQEHERFAGLRHARARGLVDGSDLGGDLGRGRLGRAALQLGRARRKVTVLDTGLPRIDAVLSTMGGQTALNCALALAKHGVLEKYNVELIGAKEEAINMAEDRNLFDQAMKRIGLSCARAKIVHTLEEAKEAPKEFGFPCIIRPSFTMGGSGGGIAYNWDEFEEICTRGLDLSPTNELLIDESLLADLPELGALGRQGIAKLAAQFMRDPATVKVEAQHAGTTIEQRWYEVGENERLPAVGRLLAHFRPESSIAFCNTKARCAALAELLQAQGISALALHGDLEQRDRDQVLVRFANGSCSVLVATDVAARGLDVANLAAVINVDISPDPEVHVHRIGRTGRAGETGLALSLASLDEMGAVGRIEQLQGRASVWHELAELTPAGGGRQRRRGPERRVRGHARRVDAPLTVVLARRALDVGAGGAPDGGRCELGKQGGSHLSTLSGKSHGLRGATPA